MQTERGKYLSTFRMHTPDMRHAYFQHGRNFFMRLPAQESLPRCIKKLLINFGDLTCVRPPFNLSTNFRNFFESTVTGNVVVVNLSGNGTTSVHSTYLLLPPDQGYLSKKKTLHTQQTGKLDLKPDRPLTKENITHQIILASP